MTAHSALKNICSGYMFLVLFCCPGQAATDFKLTPEWRAAISNNAQVANYQAFTWRAFHDLKPYYQRSDWGALPRNGSQTEMWTPIIATIHHTALPAEETGVKSAQKLQWFQMFGRGREKLDNFADVGYHFIIDGSGSIFEGRAITELGAHVRGNNRGNIGIVLIGNFEEIKPTSDQIESLVRLLTFLSVVYHVRNNYEFIQTHKDYNHATECPGTYLFSLLPDIRKQVESHLARLKQKYN